MDYWRHKFIFCKSGSVPGVPIVRCRHSAITLQDLDDSLTKAEKVFATPET